MPWRAANWRARSGSRAATARTVASVTRRAGRTSAIGAMRAAPRMPKRSGSAAMLRLLHEDGDRAGRVGVALEHDRRHAERLGLGDRLGRVHAARPVRVGTVVAMNVDGTGHQVARLVGNGARLPSPARTCYAPAVADGAG